MFRIVKMKLWLKPSYFARPAFRSLNPFKSKVVGACCSTFLLSACVAGFQQISYAQSGQETSTSLFFDDFDNSTTWSQGGNSYSYQGSRWYQYKAKLAGGVFDLGNTEWGNPIQSAFETSYPSPDIASYAILKLSTSGAIKSGLLKGTELVSSGYFFPPVNVGQAVDFEARVRIPNFGPGAIAAMYTYRDGEGAAVSVPNTPAPVRLSDEIDFEYVGKNQGRILTSAWNDWQRYATNTKYGKDGEDVIGNYNLPDPNSSDPNRFNNNNASTPLLVNQAQWHYLRIRWLRVANGYVTEWYMKQNQSDPGDGFIRQVTNTQPDEAMRLHFNIWSASPTIFPSAYSTELAANSSPAKNYELDVGWAKVSNVSNAQFVLRRTAPTTPAVSPPAGGPSTGNGAFSFNASLTPYGPNTNTILTATPSIYQPEKYNFTYRFDVNGGVVQDGTSQTLNLSTPGFGDHGDVITVVITARAKTSNDYGYATQSSTVVNTAPIANNVSDSAQSGQEIIIPLSGSDLDGDPLTFVRVGGPTNGTGGIFLDADGQYKMRYTSRANFSGVETVRFVSRDSLNRTSSVATMTISVGSGGTS